MINDANIDLAGFVASEPFFKLLDNGTSTAKLRVAYTERRFNRETGEWGDGPTSFVTVLCWRTLAATWPCACARESPCWSGGGCACASTRTPRGGPGP